MPRFKPMFIGKEAILKAFDDLASSPIYSVWISENTMLYSWNDLDKQGGRDVLERTLEAGEQNEDSNIIYIKIHPEKEIKYITNKTPVIATLISQIYSGETSAPGQSLGLYKPDNSNNLELYKLEQRAANAEAKILELTAKIEAQETEEIEEEEPDTIGRIAGILEHPVIKKLSESPEIMQLIGKVVSFVSKAIPAPETAPLSAVAGTPQKDETPDTMPQEETPQEIDMQKLTEDLQRLTPYCKLNETIAKLADLAENKEFVFKMALKQLNDL